MQIDLDFLLIDLPGTGDIHLSIVNHYQLMGCGCSTPPECALTDAKKGLLCSNKNINVPVLGIIEMSYFTPQNYHKINIIFCKKEQNISLMMEVPF